MILFWIVMEPPLMLLLGIAERLFPTQLGKAWSWQPIDIQHTANDTGTNWAEATVEISSGGDLGTPGSTNSFVLALREAVNLDFKVYPNPIKAQFIYNYDKS